MSSIGFRSGVPLGQGIVLTIFFKASVHGTIVMLENVSPVKLLETGSHLQSFSIWVNKLAFTSVFHDWHYTVTIVVIAKYIPNMLDTI